MDHLPFEADKLELLAACAEVLRDLSTAADPAAAATLSAAQSAAAQRTPLPVPPVHALTQSQAQPLQAASVSSGFGAPYRMGTANTFDDVLPVQTGSGLSIAAVSRAIERDARRFEQL